MSLRGFIFSYPIQMKFTKSRASQQDPMFGNLGSEGSLVFIWTFIFFFLPPHIKACRDLAPQPGIESMSSVAEAWSLNHLKRCWAAREVPEGLNNLPKFIELEWSLENYVPNGTGHTSVCVWGLLRAAECLSHLDQVNSDISKQWREFLPKKPIGDPQRVGSSLLHLLRCCSKSI